MTADQGFHVHKATVERIDLDKQRSLDAAVARVMEEFVSVLSVVVVIDPAIYGGDKKDVRTYHREARVSGRTPEPCSLCEQFAKTGGPPHEASPGCESGRRPHCSCEVCF